MTKKEEEIYDKVWEAVLVECSINCQKCKRNEIEYDTDDHSFTEKLIKKGWTFKRGRVICDSCNK